MRVPTLIALSAASVSALPTTDKIFKRQAAPNAPDAFGLAYTTPPVAANGGAWSAAFARAGAVTAQMTLEEKVSAVAVHLGRVKLTLLVVLTGLNRYRPKRSLCRQHRRRSSTQYPPDLFARRVRWDLCYVLYGILTDILFLQTDRA
jgi:hypothetical protein